MTTSVSCANCGAAVQADSSFCQICGAPTGIPQPAGPMEILREALKDRYRVERELGKGGMATVFLAHDLRHERDVAIKVLHQELAASMGAERFEREIKVAARLQHPHILGLYDSGVADGLLFYVMPFVKGESLRDRLDREQMLPLDDALTITLEVADALGYAHSLGIVHRDIKPENIMLTGGHALVADFGIARAITGAAAEQKLTQTGSAIGTPLYMSPEQASGDEVGPTSDLYSLGCVAYEMLTGGPPFTGANARAIMARHTMEMVPSLRVVRDTVPDYVEDAIFAVMNKVPADRPKDAKRFAAMLTGGEGVTSAGRAATRARMTAARLVPAEAKPRFSRWALAAIGLAAVLAGAGTMWKVRRNAGPATGAPNAGHLAVLYFADESRDKSLGYLADGLTEGLIRALTRANLNVAPRSGSALFRGDSTTPDDSIARTLEVGTLVKGSVEQEGANVRVQFLLVDGPGQSVITRRSFQLPAANGLAIEEALVDSVSRAIRTELRTQVVQRAQRQETRSTDAWVLVQRAEQTRKQADQAADTAQYASLIARADSQAAQAETFDKDWVTPITLRAALAYGRARRFFDPAPAGPWLELGLAHVQRALAKDRQDPDALELEGNLYYWSYLLQYHAKRLALDSLFTLARADLDSAVHIEPGQAGAWASLSHLYANDPTQTSAQTAMAASAALQADRFLGNAATIQARLFFAYYDGNNRNQAQQACSDGYHRFPDNSRFTECRLWLMTMRDVPRDSVRQAWLLADTMVLKSPPDSAQQAYQRMASRSIMAAILARAGLKDSATRVISSVRRNSDIDPSADLVNIAAFVYTRLGDKRKAVQQLTEYLNANPQRRKALASDAGWWFRDLETEPDFKTLVAAAR